MPAQLPLALRFPADQRLATFLGAPDGVLAQVESLASGRSSDWAFVSGPPSAGKSHLLLGACACAQESGRRPSYLRLGSVAGHVDDALQAFEGMDFLAIDDVDGIAGRRDDEVALFDFHNRARAAGTAVLYAATARPLSLDLVVPDLRSRLAQCTAVVLEPLGEDGRREVLRQRALRRGLVLDDAALDWLLRRVGRDLASLTHLFDRLDTAALVAQRRLTVPFLRDVLGDSLDVR
jgi:DnaA family protein